MPELKIWQLEDIGETIRGPVPETVPKTLYDDLLIGLLETGIVRACYRRATHMLEMGALILVQPDEVVAFEPIGVADSPIRICLRCPSSLLQKVANEIAGRRTARPYFPNLITPDPHLAAQFLRFQRTLELPASRLETSSHFHGMLARIIRRHASSPPTRQKIKPERDIVRRVREYLHENYADNISLDDLSRIAGLSTFHLNRVFRMEVGLPPHAYQTQVRVMRGKSLLAQGLSIDQVALKVGFFDQSHFTNHFRRLFGYTPGIYQKNISEK